MSQPFLSLSAKYTKNIGDEIQIIAANQFGQTIKGTVDREQLSEYSGNPAKMVLNGWFLWHPEHWPPAVPITPLITSLHLTDLPGPQPGDCTCPEHLADTTVTNPKNPRETVTEGDGLAYFKQYAPVGARDIETYTFLQSKGIPTYFSGCLTLTLKPKGLPKKDTVCIVDAGQEVTDYVKQHSPFEPIVLDNSYLPDGTPYNDPSVSYDDRMARAHDTLAAYEQARVIVTTRLHAALPGLALGTPVILIHNKNADSSRYLGLKDLVRNFPEEEFLAGHFRGMLWDPEPNSDRYRVIADNLETIVTNFVHDRTPVPNPEAISAQNLLTVLKAKEENERELHKFAISKI